MQMLNHTYLYELFIKLVNNFNEHDDIAQYHICLKKRLGVYYYTGPLGLVLKQDGRLFEVGVCSLKLFWNYLKVSIHHYQSYN